MCCLANPEPASTLSTTGQIKVSCLLVTLPVPERFGYFQRSVAAFCRQTHRNSELVIVLDRGSIGSRSAIVAFVESLGRRDIRIVDPPTNRTLGALRNVSVESARGDVLCQWDDDDLHHPQRIERQLEALVAAGGESVHLEEVMQYFEDSRTLYCTQWRATEAKGLPGTVMCRRSAPIRYPEAGADSQHGEDLAVSLQLQQHGGFHALAGAPHLYVYVSHGANTWADDHHWMLARELSISRALLRRREAQLREGLRPFDFGPGEVTVQGYNGAAFTL
jgi:glycosyltransferase involved in cell wall biosynthesis